MRDRLGAEKSGFDVENRSAINRFYRANSQAILFNVTNHYMVKSDRIRAVRRARGEHSGQTAAWIGTGTDFEGLPIGPMEPGQNHKFVARGYSLERIEREGADF